MGAAVSDIDKFIDDLPAFSFPSGVAPRRLNPAPKPPTVEVEWDSRPIIMKRQGVDTEFFPIGSLSKALGFQPVTIRKWERLGRLPLSRYRTPAPKNHPVEGKTPMGRRLYTRRQVEVVIDAAKQAGVTDPEVRVPDWQKFTKIVVDGWRSIS